MGLIYDDCEGLPPYSEAISSRMNGNFCTVEDDDLLPFLDELPEVARALGMSDGRPDLHEKLDGLWIWSSRMRRSVTTMTESKASVPSRFTPMSWWASHAMVRQGDGPRSRSRPTCAAA